MAETDDHQRKDRKKKDDEAHRPGIVARLKKLHEEKPIPFAFGVIGVSAVLFVAGVLLTGESITIPPGPFGP